MLSSRASTVCEGLTIAQAIAFLAGPRASYITGTTIHVDAGGTAI